MAMLLLLGAAAGLVSGLIGIGGGVVIVPALIYGFGLTQHQAQGTTLAMLVPPVGLLAAWAYYRQGDVDIRMAALMCAGFFLGAWLGAHFAMKFSNDVLRRVFGAGMLLISLKMIFGK